MVSSLVTGAPQNCSSVCAPEYVGDMLVACRLRCSELMRGLQQQYWTEMRKPLSMEVAHIFLFFLIMHIAACVSECNFGVASLARGIGGYFTYAIVVTLRICTRITRWFLFACGRATACAKHVSLE